MPLAIFDLDNTLLNGDSDHSWGEFLVQQGIVDAVTYKKANDLFYQHYQNGTLNILDYLAFSLKPLAEHPKSQLDLWHRQFMQSMVLPMRLQKADQLLAKHRANGDYLLIITATNAFVTRPIAELLGVDAILATEPEFINGAYTGKVQGTPCFKEGKVTRLKEWLAETGFSLEGSYFYSDSQNDLPLLNMVDHPVAVDADPVLRAHAEQAGWPVISLRD
jgi:HAD superfamily hydrolase (TIGR01490 family)